MISKETYEIVRDNAEQLNSAVIYDRDFSYVSIKQQRTGQQLMWRLLYRTTSASKPLSAPIFFALTTRSPNGLNTCSCAWPLVSTVVTLRGL
jgi:hypothetical protein